MDGLMLMVTGPFLCCLMRVSSRFRLLRRVEKLSFCCEMVVTADNVTPAVLCVHTMCT